MNRYQNIPVIRNSQGIRYYKDSKYPQIPLSVDDIYVITTEGDRLDLLAQQYYGDSSLWWIISTANETLSQNSLFIPLGTQLRIPSNPSTVLINYASLNK
jgi:nucleoid-associated protein YgaU